MTEHHEPPRLPLNKILPAEDDPRPGTIEITITENGRALWQGPLRVSRVKGDNVSNAETQSGPTHCPGPPFRHHEDYNKTLTVRLSRAGLDPDGAWLQDFSISFRRPEYSCANGLTVRTAQLSGIMRLLPGQPLVMRGDAGLVASLVLQPD